MAAEPSPWVLLMRAAEVHAARKVAGIVNGEQAAFARWLAQRRDAGPERYDCVSLMAFEVIMQDALDALGGEDTCDA